MSIQNCEVCSYPTDTDYYPEVYREEYNNAALCDECYDTRKETESMEKAQHTAQQIIHWFTFTSAVQISMLQKSILV